MNPFSMTVLIVLIVAISRVMRERYRALGRGGAAPSSADSVQQRDEVRQLKERVAVLERALTDNHKTFDLDREIERLRHDGPGERGRNERGQNERVWGERGRDDRREQA